MEDIRGRDKRRMDLIQNHVRSTQSIAVLLDGRYDYTIESATTSTMNADAMDDIAEQ